MGEQHAFLQERLSRRTVLKGAALLSAGPLLLRSAGSGSTRSPVARDLPMGPRWIGFGADPRTSMTLSTSMAGSFRSASVEYGTDTSFGQTAPLDVKGVAGTHTRYGAARLTGLSPGTSYSYRMRVDGRLGATGTFATAPQQSGAFTFTAFGDEGTTSAARSIVGQIAQQQPDLHLVAGDLCYADSSGTGNPADVITVGTWDRWLKIIEPVAATVPWMTTVGNHEMEPGFGPQGYNGYLARFAVPQTGARGCPATYAFRYGSVAFIQVDSNDVSWEIPHNLGYSHGTQDTWLESVLRGYRTPGSGVDFVVVTMHHCAYSTARAHGSEGGVRKEWVPLFDRYGVDLVISGHNHSYERSHPLRAGSVSALAPKGSLINSAAGTTYLTLGGGGAGLNTEGFFNQQFKISTPETVTTHRRNIEPGADFSAVTAMSYCYAAGKVTPGTANESPMLELTMSDQNGAELDAVTLVRDESMAPHRRSASSDDTGLYAGVGIGAAVLATAGAGGYLAYRRRTA
jgi:hypothetical protein